MTERQKFPIPSAEREDVEEALGLLWHQRELGQMETETVQKALSVAGSPEAFQRLVQHGYIREESGRVVMTAQGESFSQDDSFRHFEHSLFGSFAFIFHSPFVRATKPTV